MKKYFAISLALLLVVVLLSECKTKSAATTTTVTPTAPPTPEMADIAAGQAIFNSACDKCHKQPNPRKHDNEGWKITMSKMGPKAQLNDAQTAQVLKYLASENK